MRTHSAPIALRNTQVTNSAPHFLLTLGFLLTVLGGLIIRQRVKPAGHPSDHSWARAFPARRAETLSLWTMNGTAIVLVFAPDLLSELALCVWMAIAAILYWYAAWNKPAEPLTSQRLRP